MKRQQSQQYDSLNTYDLHIGIDFDFPQSTSYMIFSAYATIRSAKDRAEIQFPSDFIEVTHLIEMDTFPLIRHSYIESIFIILREKIIESLPENHVLVTDKSLESDGILKETTGNPTEIHKDAQQITREHRFNEFLSGTLTQTYRITTVNPLSTNPYDPEQEG